MMNSLSFKATKPRPWLAAEVGQEKDGLAKLSENGAEKPLERPHEVVDSFSSLGDRNKTKEKQQDIDTSALADKTICIEPQTKIVETEKVQEEEEADDTQQQIVTKLAQSEDHDADDKISDHENDGTEPDASENSEADEMDNESGKHQQQQEQASIDWDKVGTFDETTGKWDIEHLLLKFQLVNRQIAKVHEHVSPKYTEKQREAFGINDEYGGITGTLQPRSFTNFATLLCGGHVKGARYLVKSVENDDVHVGSEYRFEPKKSVFCDIGSGSGRPSCFFSCLDLLGSVGFDIDPMQVINSYNAVSILRKGLGDQVKLFAPLYFSHEDVSKMATLEPVTHAYAFVGYSGIVHATATLVARTSTIKVFIVVVLHMSDLADTGILDDGEDIIVVPGTKMPSGRCYKGLIIPIHDQRRLNVLRAIAKLEASTPVRKYNGRVGGPDSPIALEDDNEGEIGNVIPVQEICNLKEEQTLQGSPASPISLDEHEKFTCRNEKEDLVGKLMEPESEKFETVDQKLEVTPAEKTTEENATATTNTTENEEDKPRNEKSELSMEEEIAKEIEKCMNESKFTSMFHLDLQQAFQADDGLEKLAEKVHKELCDVHFSSIDKESGNRQSKRKATSSRPNYGEVELLKRGASVTTKRAPKKKRSMLHKKNTGSNKKRRGPKLNPVQVDWIPPPDPNMEYFKLTAFPRQKVLGSYCKVQWDDNVFYEAYVASYDECTGLYILRYFEDNSQEDNVDLPSLTVLWPKDLRRQPRERCSPHQPKSVSDVTVFALESEPVSVSEVQETVVSSESFTTSKLESVSEVQETSVAPASEKPSSTKIDDMEPNTVESSDEQAVAAVMEYMLASVTALST